MKLAIKGHPTRGKEVIALLKMLGGANPFSSNSEVIGNKESNCYYISENTGTKYISWDYIGPEEINEYKIFTLEEFEQKFPYKVGDKVNYIKYNDEYSSVYTIQSMRWTGVTIEYVLDSSGFSALTKDLQPYKEEIMEEENFGECVEKTIQECLFGKEETTKESANKAIFEGNAQSCDIMNDIIKKDIEQIKLDIPEGYEFFGIDDNNKVVLTKIQPKYPKTFEECCEIMQVARSTIWFEYDDISSISNEGDAYEKRIENTLLVLRKLIICRDAYWKIAGEEMGLGKSWNQDYNDRCFIITNNKGNIYTYEYHGSINIILVFPTEEMRDAFYENFKDLIEECKELV